MTTVDRRAHFRDYMRRLDPTASPERAMAEGFYVAPPSAVTSRIGARLDIEPASSHLVLGGIGSGKTTALLAIRSHLLSVPDAAVAMVDVLTRQRETKLGPGVLLALAGLELLDWVARERAGRVDLDALERTRRAVHGVAHGRVEDDEPDDYSELDYGEHWVPGVLEEPLKTSHLEVVAREIHDLERIAGVNFTVLFDGLDRLPDPRTFAEMIRVDIPLLKRASVGVVVVGPQSLRFEADRSSQDVFSDVHLHGSVNIEIAEGWAFLRGVLRRRVEPGILPDAACDRIIQWSGGVIRDLIALARAAGETAYSLGHDAVEVDDVDAAADRFGRALVLGMSKAMLERLIELTSRYWPGLIAVPPRSEPWVVATDADVSLLLHRVMIEVPTTPVRYLVHPTIVPLLPHLLRKTA